MPRPPLQSITSVNCRDSDGNLIALSESTDYLVDTAADPGTIEPAPNKSWPAVGDYPDAVQVRFVAGYGNATAPAMISCMAVKKCRMKIFFWLSRFWRMPSETETVERFSSSTPSAIPFTYRTMSGRFP